MQELQSRSTIKLLSAADNPAGYQMVTRIEGKVDGLSAFEENMSLSKAALQDMDTSLDQIEDAMGEVVKTVTSASNGTWGPADLNVMSNNIDAMLEHIVDRVNSANGLGEFAYSGSNGKVEPYQITRNAAGEITGMTYQGDAEEKNIKVSPSQSVTTTANGEDVFGAAPNSLFNTLIEIRDQMRTGTFDSAIGQGFSNQLDDHLESVSFQRSSAGVEVNRIEKLEHFNTSMRDNYNDLLVKTKDADFTEVATQLMLHQTALQMSAQLGRVLNNMVFVDFN